jgi:LytS/YehU family sensor histidine kinase
MNAMGIKYRLKKRSVYLQDYVDLQKLRRGSDDEVVFDLSDDVRGFSIEPLLLMPFVENSFKHLSHFSNGKKNLVKINAAKANGEFHFSVTNTIEFASTKDPLVG